MEIFCTEGRWNERLPETLVVACSDGRFQEEVDEFLERHLAIRRYNRLYLPGGAGALVANEIEAGRGDRFRSECRFLIELHGIKRVVLMFHGPAEEGPDAAACGDYRRRLPELSLAAIRARQEEDAKRLCHEGLGDGVGLEIYRCEVMGEGMVRFVQMHG